jgi:hypothetical protein
MHWEKVGTAPRVLCNKLTNPPRFSETESVAFLSLMVSKYKSRSKKNS